MVGVKEMLLGNTYMEATLIYLSIHAVRRYPTVDLIFLLVLADRFGEHCCIPRVRTEYAGG